MDESGDADRRAASTLHIPSAARRHFLIDRIPARAGFHGYRRLRRMRRLAAPRHEGIVQRYGVHLARPDHQRVDGIGGALVAVTTALHDESQIVLPSEVHGRDDVVGRAYFDRIGALARSPSIQPT